MHEENNICLNRSEYISTWQSELLKMCQLHSDLPRKGSQNDSLPVYVKAGRLRNQVISRVMHMQRWRSAHSLPLLYNTCAAAQLQWGSCRRVRDVTYLLLKSVLRVSEETSPSGVSRPWSDLPHVPAVSSSIWGHARQKSLYCAGLIQISLMRVKTTNRTDFQETSCSYSWDHF